MTKITLLERLRSSPGRLPVATLLSFSLLLSGCRPFSTGEPRRSVGERAQEIKQERIDLCDESFGTPTTEAARSYQEYVDVACGRYKSKPEQPTPPQARIPAVPNPSELFEPSPVAEVPQEVVDRAIDSFAEFEKYFKERAGKSWDDFRGELKTAFDQINQQLELPESKELENELARLTSTAGGRTEEAIKEIEGFRVSMAKTTEPLAASKIDPPWGGGSGFSWPVFASGDSFPLRACTRVSGG